MSQGLMIFLISAYAVSVLSYIIRSLAKKTKMVLLPIFVFLPLVGPTAMIIIAIGSAFGKEKHIDVFEEDGEEKKKFVYLTQINDEKEMNIVPMKEAMALNKTSTQRDIVFELAKGDPIEYIKNLKSALLSEDSEVAHYAASSIAKFKREMDKALSDREDEFSHHPELGKNRNALIKALDDAIHAELVPSEEIFRLQNRIIEILMMEIRLGDSVTEEHYRMICNYMLKVKDYTNFEIWLSEFRERFPSADDPLRLKLQYAYYMKNQELFNEVINDAKNARYAITKETLSMIEFWSQGEQS
ncbi:MAG: hypothetical protein AB1Z19_05395 [Eubacteriales bacterium]